MNQAALFGPQVAALFGNIYELAQFRLAVDRGMTERCAQAKEPSQGLARAIKDEDEWAKDRREQFERPRHEQRQTFSAFERKHLRHQFAEDDVQERDGSKRDRNRQ